MIEPPHSMRDAAVALARDGFRVFKLMVNGKRPAVKEFQNVATNDVKRVYEMWSAPVTGDSLHNNIGILTGGDFMVVDIDVKDGKLGLDTLDHLIDYKGFDTNTWTARSPTGSLHYFLALPDGRETRNTVEKLGPGIDTRGHHGYVVAAGSVTKDGIYGWLIGPNEDGIEMALAPAWLLDEVEQRKEPTSNPADELVVPDDESAIKRAVEYLTKSAPEATLRAGSNTVTYAIAQRVKDFGVSQQTNFELMLEHWNEQKSNPPWPPEKLERVVENAYRYGQEAIGRASAHADFTAVDNQDSPATSAWPVSSTFSKFEPSLLPKREWIVQNFLVRGFVAGVVSPGGMGKTQFIANVCLAIAANTAQPIGMPVIEQTGVWYWNQEDDMDELRRRFAAAMQHHGVGWADIGNRIRLDSGVEKPLVLVKRLGDGRIVENKKVVDQIIAECLAQQIGVFTFDPLVEFHEAEENDNVQMRTVMATARRIAVEGKCAVLAVAHTRKPSGASAEGFAGDMDALRGAGAQANVMRLMHTLFGMTVKDAKQYGVHADQRHLYVRMDTAKSNLSLIDGKPLWMKRVSVVLGGVDGETIGVLEPVALIERGPEVNIAHIIATTIADSLTRGAWHGTGDVVAEMHDGDKEAIGARNNWSRNITKNMEGLGLDTKSATAVDLMTDAGVLRIVNRRGNIGFQFLLMPE